MIILYAVSLSSPCGAKETGIFIQVTLTIMTVGPSLLLCLQKV